MSTYSILHMGQFLIYTFSKYIVLELKHGFPSSSEESTFSLSFHTTPLSSPFFTLPPTSPTEEKVVWAVERGDEAMGGLRSLVVRVWIQVLKMHYNIDLGQEIDIFEYR